MSYDSPKYQTDRKRFLFSFDRIGLISWCAGDVAVERKNGTATQVVKLCQQEGDYWGWRAVNCTTGESVVVFEMDLYKPDILDM